MSGYKCIPKSQIDVGWFNCTGENHNRRDGTFISWKVITMTQEKKEVETAISRILSNDPTFMEVIFSSILYHIHIRIHSRQFRSEKNSSRIGSQYKLNPFESTRYIFLDSYN